MKNTETERKFLVNRKKWLAMRNPPCIPYIQGYLSIDEDKVVRIRVAGEKGFLTIKGKSETISHPEFEYVIPAVEAGELIQLYAISKIEKVRTRIQIGKHIWEVDEFHGDNEGLLMAEIELEGPQELFDKPVWLGAEVTGDKRYYNAYLSIHPYKKWQKNPRK